MTYLTPEKKRVKGLTPQHPRMSQRLVKPHPTRKTKTTNGIGKIGDPIRYKNFLYYPDVGDRVSQVKLVKKYLKKAGYTYKKRILVY